MEDNNDCSTFSKDESVDDKSFDMSSVKESIPNNEANEEFFDANDNESESEEDIDLDEDELLNAQKDMSEDELERQKSEALNLKVAGNDCFKASNHKEAVSLYTRALNICPLKYKDERSVLYSNRAAAKIGLEKKDVALLDCNKAIELNPDYLRAILRRAQLHKKLDNLDRCLEDYKKVLELDKNNSEARQACATLPAEIAERNEKLKQEMFGKLKDLGNICLKPFGLSTDNFKMVQDPNTGGYSVNFQK